MSKRYKEQELQAIFSCVPWTALADLEGAGNFSASEFILWLPVLPHSEECIMGPKEFTQTIISGLEKALLPHGFQRNGTTLIADHTEVSFLISLEKESTTRKDSLVFSVYVGVYSKVLAHCIREKAGIPDRTEPVQFRWYNCHWKRNIANALGDNQGMKIWRVHNEQQALDVSEKIAELLQDWGLPHLNKLSSTAKIATFLHDGGGNNITDPPRQDTLKILEDFLLKRMVEG